MKRILYAIALLGSLQVSAQQLPVYSQFFINPYMYNPAFVGNSRYTEIYLFHRQQWMGIEEAPKTSGISIHLPTYGKVAYGMNIQTDKRGVLSTTSALFTIGYRAQLGKNQYLMAGLSGGVGMSSVNATRVDNPNDPAVANFMSRNSFLDGNVGINYQFKNLNIGVSLPKIFQKSVIVIDQQNQAQIKRLDHFLITTSYKFHLSDGAIVLEPVLLYQVARGIPAQFEAIGVVHLRDKVWIGGSYRQNYGPTAFAGFKISDMFRFGYGYEIASSQVNGFSSGTHEMSLNIRFGKKKEKVITPTTNYGNYRATNTHPASPSNNVAPKPALNPIRPDSLLVKDENNQLIQNDQANYANTPEEKIPVQQRVNQLELTKGHYVVVSAFRVFDNALRNHESLSDKFHNCKYGYSSKTMYYYSYLLYTTDINRARFERDKMKKIDGFDKTWVLTVE